MKEKSSGAFLLQLYVPTKALVTSYISTRPLYFLQGYLQKLKSGLYSSLLLWNKGTLPRDDYEYKKMRIRLSRSA